MARRVWTVGRRWRPGARHNLAAFPRLFVTGFRAEQGLLRYASMVSHLRKPSKIVSRFQKHRLPAQKFLRRRFPVTGHTGVPKPRKPTDGSTGGPTGSHQASLSTEFSDRIRLIPKAVRVIPAVSQTFRSTRGPPSLLYQFTRFPGQSMPVAGTSRTSSPPPHSPAQFVGLLNRRAGNRIPSPQNSQ